MVKRAWKQAEYSRIIAAGSGFMLLATICTILILLTVNNRLTPELLGSLIAGGGAVGLIGLAVIALMLIRQGIPAQGEQA